jgi:hypothetical protein
MYFLTAEAVLAITFTLQFNFWQMQFPVLLAFAMTMTINKSQGHTIKVVRFNLIDPFSHGQLCVACSRVSNPKNLFVLAPSGSTI